MKKIKFFREPWGQEIVEKTEGAFSQTKEFIVGIVREGQKSGEFSVNYDADILGEILHNTLLGLRVNSRKYR